MITKENFKQELFKFAREKYRTKFKQFYEEFKGEFPYDYEELDDELYFKNWLDWLIIEKPLPETGKTIAEEFIESNPELPKEIEEGMLRMRNVVRGKFKVIYILGKDLMLRQLGTGKEYKIKLYNEHSQLRKGDLIEGKIHEFDEKYRFCGAFLMEKPHPFLMPDVDMMMDGYNQSRINEIENQIITENKKMTAMLNSYPFQWVDGICQEFDLDVNRKKNEKVKLIAEKLFQDLPMIVENLPEKSKEALKLILEEGGAVRYNKLKNYDDEIGFWWNEEGMPTSTIGRLRAKALLFVGKMPLGGRMYKAAMIPKEIREGLKKVL